VAVTGHPTEVLVHAAAARTHGVGNGGYSGFADALLNSISQYGAKTGLAPSAETADDAQAEVDAAVEELTRAGIKAHGKVRNTIYGYAAREIVEDAKTLDVSVIIMGSRGRGDLAGLVLGSTADKVIHLADRPVLVVR
jgi:nucleotide-binding universal stress UspA family protein